mgnify:CR=1 FL=1
MAGVHATEEGGYVEVSHSDNLNIGDGDSTMTLWVRRGDGSDRKRSMALGLWS